VRSFREQNQYCMVPVLREKIVVEHFKLDVFQIRQ
jgi:hypothetical protein